jgi:hypothetical protein
MCQHPEHREPVYDHPSDSIVAKQTETILNVLHDAESVDSLIYHSGANERLLLIQAGYIIDSTQKHALVVSWATDTTVHVELWAPSGITWWRWIDGEEYYCDGTVLNPEIRDFDFDKRNDIFLAVHCSNGTALSRGHLFLTDSTSGSDILQHHREAYEIYNPMPDTSRKIIRGDSLISCRGTEEICKIEFSWANEVLTRTGKACPCVSDK